ncbi:MAG: dockerin type I domain-containing protein [Limisphaerales bacterium]
MAKIISIPVAIQAYNPRPILQANYARLRGDVNGDCIITSGDIVYLNNYVNRRGPAPVVPGSGDVNCDCFVNRDDVDYLTNYTFLGEPIPCALGDPLSCLDYGP